jgi:hypothetical protein
MRVRVEISPGELIDKMTILDIKIRRIKDEEKLAHIKAEFDTLQASYQQLLRWLTGNKANITSFTELSAQLFEVNQKIWDIEDTIRDLESRGEFGPSFVETARSVYFTNDERARLKQEIDKLFGSDIQLEKSYTDYSRTEPQGLPSESPSG